MKWKLVSIAFISTLASLSGSAFADLLYDCSLIENDTQTALINTKLESFPPLLEKDRASAMSDLKSYCCQKGVSTKSCESAKQNTSNPESPYIFDQMVSRGFFKLDNKTEGSRDAKAVEWSEKIKEWVDSGKGKAPVGIQNIFDQIWQPAKWESANINQYTCEITNYDSLDLAARYGAVCKQAACIRTKFVTVNSDLDGRYNTDACMAMASKRIKDEMTYVQTLMVRKANTLMKDVWTTYTQSYLLENRRGTLIDKFSRVNETFSTVNGKVQEGTRMCSGG